MKIPTLLCALVTTLFASLNANALDPKEIEVGDSISFVRDVFGPLRVSPIVAILGSSRLGETTPAYQLTKEVTRAFTAKGFGVLTGGGPGLMDAANRTARQSKVLSVGFDTVSFWPRSPLTFIDNLFVFQDLQVRKRAMMQTACAFVVMPGGIGTLDEVFTLLGAEYSEQLEKKPIILVDSQFWKPLANYLTTTLVSRYGTADQKHVDLLRIVDTPADALVIALSFKCPQH